MVMERNLTTEAIVLTNKRWGDLHRLVTMLSPSLGIFDAVAYGARKGKLAGGIDPFVIGTFYVYHNQARKVRSITDIEVTFQGEGIRDDLARLYIAHAMAEMAMRMHGGDHEQLYGILSRHLVLLAQREVEPRRLFMQFALRFIAIMGLESDLSSCPVCAHPYETQEILYYHTGLHAPCCRSCADIDTETFEMALGPGGRKYLELTRNMEEVSAVSVDLTEATTERLFRYMVRQVNDILGSALRSLTGGVLTEALQ